MFATLLAAAPVWARIELAPHIQDRMVVQRGMPWEVSGTANDRDRFNVEFRDQRIEARPAGGTWSVRFDVPSNFTGPAELIVAGGRLSREVLVGDIWLCSGQSNMVLPVARASDGGHIDASSRRKGLRIYQVPKPITGRTQANTGQWIATTAPGHIGRFSAVCLAFGAALHDRIKVPVGLIDSSLGGTWIESWISSQSFDKLSVAESARRRYAKITRQRKATGRHRNIYGIYEPSQLFDLMVRPLVWQSIKGVLWYQGEGNRGNAEQYQELLSVLMTDWRAHWRNSSLPFVIMQLPGFGTPAAAFDADSAWAAVRDAQRRAVASSQPAGLVVSIDFGDGTIHPGAKLPFGRRAANVAFGLVYEQGSRERIPMPTALSFEKAAATVEFDQGRACLEATPYLSEMVFIAGDDHRWRVAEVSVGRSSLVARSTQVSRPVAVRYAWSDYPRVGLRTCGERVPVTPFRTDDWR